MLTIAEKIVDQQTGDFDPSEFTDRYEDALRALTAQKQKGKPVKVSKPADDDDGKVVDLLAALKKSLQGSGGTARREPSRGGPAGKVTKLAPKKKHRRAA